MSHHGDDNDAITSTAPLESRMEPSPWGTLVPMLALTVRMSMGKQAAL